MKWRRFSAAALAAVLLAADEAAVENAVAALERGDLTAAEHLLRADLSAHPQDGPALEVLAVVLDEEKRWAEADEMYRKALAARAPSPGLLNNYGNHLLSMNRLKEAQAAFLKAQALAPNQANASVQLARIALQLQQPAQADRYLDALPAEVARRPDIQLLRMQTDFALGRTKAGEARQLELMKTGDPKQLFALGAALSAAGRSSDAEKAFAKSLELQPGDSEAFYALGSAAFHAGHYERARDAWREVVSKQPDNADALLDLAAAEGKLKNAAAALPLLIRARKIAPQRRDILFALAHAAADAGDFDGAIEAWDAYVKLSPEDDVARRERAFDESAIGKNQAAALLALESYVRKHPADAAGHYELGIAQAAAKPDEARAELSRALQLKPDLAAAYLARGRLLYRANQAEAARKDLEAAARYDPNNPNAWDRLGEVDLSLNRGSAAVDALEKAEQLAPKNGTVLLHLARALSTVGRKDEAAPLFARYRVLAASNRTVAPRSGGLVDFLELPAAERAARYQAGVSRAVEEQPNNTEAQVRYLGLLLEERKLDQLPAQLGRIVALRPEPALVELAARELLDAEQYGPAEEFITQTGTRTPELTVDLALCANSLRGPEPALAILDAVPSGNRSGAYDLLRAQLEEASGRSGEAEEALARALAASVDRPDVFRSAGLEFLRERRYPDAERILQKAVNVFPEDPELHLLAAISGSLAGRNLDGEFRQIETHWPEWPQAWMAHAVVLAADGKRQQADENAQLALTLAPKSVALQKIASQIDAQKDARDPGQRLEMFLALFSEDGQPK